jgi:hypothetical protein
MLIRLLKLTETIQAAVYRPNIANDRVKLLPCSKVGCTLLYVGLLTYMSLE